MIALSAPAKLVRTWAEGERLQFCENSKGKLLNRRMYYFNQDY